MTVSFNFAWIMGTFLIILGIYLLYNFIVYFVIPIYKTTKKVQEQFQNMQHSQNDSTPRNQKPFNSFQSNTRGSDQTQANSKDYIDFEEIKD